MICYLVCIDDQQDWVHRLLDFYENYFGVSEDNCLLEVADNLQKVIKAECYLNWCLPILLKAIFAVRIFSYLDWIFPRFSLVIQSN